MTKWTIFSSRHMLLSATLIFGGVTSASADSITLSNVVVQLDPVTDAATISAALTAHSDAGSDVFLDGFSVSLSENDMPLDLTAGPVTLDDAPFFTNTPPSLPDAATLPPVVLFRLLGLVPGASYTGSFFLIQGGDPLEIPAQDFSFTGPQREPPAPVPEPATVWLMLAGVVSLVVSGRGRAAFSALPRAPREIRFSA